MSRSLNRTSIFAIFAISLCSASPEVTSTCRDGEPGQDECASAVSSSFIQKAINKNRLRSDSASEAVRADESILNEKVSTTVGVKVAMSFPRVLTAARLQGRSGNRKHGLRSMFMSTTGHETQLKSKSKLGFKLKFASKSKRNQLSPEICPMCGEQEDDASCMALCGPACSEVGLNGTDCTECAVENGCIECLDCHVNVAHDQEDYHEDQHEDICPMCGEQDDNASCMALCGPACSEVGLNGTDCTECAVEHGCIECLDCHAAHDHEDNHEDQHEDICPMCGEQDDNASCVALCSPACSEVGLNGTDCTECAMEHGCIDCLDCHAAHDHEDKHEDICPMCGEQDDNASCMALCGPACEVGLNGTDCTECAMEHGCIDCLDCYAAWDKDNNEGQP